MQDHTVTSLPAGVNTVTVTCDSLPDLAEMLLYTEWDLASGMVTSGLAYTT